MKISTIKGHLTATEKRHIKALFDRNIMNGKINRKTYHIKPLDNNEHEVSIIENRTDWCELEPSEQINKVKLLIK